VCCAQYSCFLQFLDIVLSRYAAQVFSEGFWNRSSLLLLLLLLLLILQVTIFIWFVSAFLMAKQVKSFVSSHPLHVNFMCVPVFGVLKNGIIIQDDLNLFVLLWHCCHVFRSIHYQFCSAREVITVLHRLIFWHCWWWRFWSSGMLWLVAADLTCTDVSNGSSTAFILEGW
jgi:hypothetical protein